MEMEAAHRATSHGPRMYSRSLCPYVGPCHSTINVTITANM